MLKNPLQQKKLTTSNLLDFDTHFRNAGYLQIAGIDEAGRGPLAGPVVAAAVILPPGWFFDGINDSKKLTESQRDCCYEQIVSNALAWSFGTANHEIIDNINILKATYLAVQEAINGLAIKPDYLLLDALKLTDCNIPQQSLIKGDATSLSIASASIIAKVTRDRMMVNYDKEYPGYGFAKHKGYGTKAHYEALDKMGPCPIHRNSFLKTWQNNVELF